jgi:uncharacterized membrane protein
MKNPAPNASSSHPTQDNIEAISSLEHDALSRRSVIERLSDGIARLVGSVAFLFCQVVLFIVWAAANLKPLHGMKIFDPLPFGVLALVISSESVFLTIFVLISQNRMSRQSERRAHLSLQVGMLAEQELTTMLKMQQKICEHLGINIESARKEVRGFSETTDVHKLASELEEKLPGPVS